jgi:predicted O-methyltransferase YrrM
MPNPSVLRALRTARAMRTAVFRPPWVESGHFYSPMTAPADAERAAAWAENVPSALPGVDISADQQLVFASKLANSLNEPLPGPRYYPDNSQFGPADGAVYRAILNELRPARVVEVGSGFSTAVLLDEADRSQLDVEVTCIEPYPQRLLGLMRDSDRERVTLHRKPVQDVPLDVYNQLGSGDILFIDSTHVVKAGSDVNWLFLRVLPQLNEGVVVHIHDIFWPFEYPKTWLCERRDWTEDYLLHAFLIGNDSWRIMLFSSWLWKNHPELVPDHLRGREPGSIWLRRVNNLAVDVTPIVGAAVKARCPRPPH